MCWQQTDKAQAGSANKKVLKKINMAVGQKNRSANR